MSKRTERFWIKIGRDHKQRYRRHSLHIKMRNRKQEREILRMLNQLEFSSVLEVGCGWGRLTKLIMKRFNPSPYVAFDISADQIRNAREYVGNKVDFRVSSISNFAFKENSYDLVFASAVLMHIPPKEVRSTIDKMVFATKKYVVNVDWYEPGYKGIPEWWCFHHDYMRLYLANPTVKSVSRYALREPIISHLLKGAKIRQSLFCALKQERLSCT